MGWLGRLFRGKKQFNMLMAGLGSAGKTTVLNFLKTGVRDASVMPTLGADIERVRTKVADIQVIDVGGQQAYRGLWAEFAPKADVLVYVIDSTDHEGMPLAGQLFAELLGRVRSDCRLLVLANKQDLVGALSSEEVMGRLGLASCERTFRIQATSAVTGVGLVGAFRWIITACTGVEVPLPSKVTDIMIYNRGGVPLAVQSTLFARGQGVHDSPGASLTGAFLSAMQSFSREIFTEELSSVVVSQRKMVFVRHGEDFVAVAVTERDDSDAEIQAMLGTLLGAVAGDPEDAQAVLNGFILRHFA
jgi:small GTP-binding protein